MAQSLYTLLRDVRIPNTALKKIYTVSEDSAPDVYGAITAGDLVVPNGVLVQLAGDEPVSKLGNGVSTWDELPDFGAGAPVDLTAINEAIADLELRVTALENPE